VALKVLPGGLSIPRVSLGEEEPERRRIEQHLAGTVNLVVGSPSDCWLRLVGPAEIQARGARVLRQHRLRSPDIPAVVLLPGDAPWSLVRDCFREGAQDVLSLDELGPDLPRTIRRVMERTASGRGFEDEAQLMAAELGKRARELEAALLAVRAAYDQTLVALVSALDCRERETASHSQRVACYSVLLGARLGLEETELETLYRGALLHDIGKIGTPDAVLLKPGAFTDEEWEIMRRHTEVGGEILSNIAFLKAASDVPMSHHEAWDGSGYPRGLKGEEIPLQARIFAVVDSYDAIRSERPYKCAQTHATALALLQKAAGKRLDPSLVETFIAEPEASWNQLEYSLSRNLTFEGALQTCQQVAQA
jgi:putative nucleotidyltransferase with HDIG domain